MKAKRSPVLVLLALAAVLSFGLVACGDDDNDVETAANSAAESAEEAADEAGEAAEEAGEDAQNAAGGLERSVKVEIVNFAYDPDPVQVATGGKVIWQNMDSAPHTATADGGSFDTGNLEEGKIKSESFKTAGTFTYFCEIHPEMHGTVEVIDQE